MTKNVSLEELAMTTKGKAKSIIKRAKKQKQKNGSISKKDIRLADKLTNRLMEEMNEVSKEITKAKRYGYLAEHNNTGELYIERMLDEMQDVIDNISATRKVLKPLIKEAKKLKK